MVEIIKQAHQILNINPKKLANRVIDTFLKRVLSGASFSEPRSEYSLLQILAEARGEDYARPNRFEILIFPPIQQGSPAASTRKVSLRCETISVPFRTLTTLEDANIYGPTRRIANGVDYAGTVDLTFQSSGDLTERVFFEEWQNQAFDETSWNLRYYNDYVSEIQIYLLDVQDNRRYGVVLHEAYPTTINAIELSQPSSTEIVKTSVVMTFRWWQTLDLNRKEDSTRPTTDVIAVRSKNINLPSSISKLGRWI